LAAATPPRALLVRDGADAAAGLAYVEDHLKILSWLVFHRAGVPTLAGLIVFGWTSAVEDLVRAFAQELGIDTLLIRSDKAQEVGSAPRGGYTVSLDDLEQEARWFLDQGRTVYLLEPRSPFDDLYSLSLAPSEQWSQMAIELVGPGFDASDLKRGDVTPHETCQVALTDARVQILDRTICSQRAYEQSWRSRVQKAARLLCLPSAQHAQRDVGERVVFDALMERGETLLFRDRAGFTPISLELLEFAATETARLRPALEAIDVSANGVVVSMSFVGEHAEPVFWDVVWPRLKYAGSLEEREGSE
jgi:hypothetical protein